MNRRTDLHVALDQKPAELLHQQHRIDDWLHPADNLRKSKANVTGFIALPGEWPEALKPRPPPQQVRELVSKHDT